MPFGPSFQNTFVGGSDVAKPPPLTITITISAGQSLSNPADLTTGSIALIITPPDWNPANVSFQISEDNVTFYDLFDSNGAEIIRAIRPNTAIAFDLSLTQAAPYFKMRSGHRDIPIAQAADRVFTLILI